MPSHMHDHELKIDSTTDQFTLVRDENGKALYQVIEDIPQYQPYLSFTQDNWNGGHGQHDFTERDRYFDGQSIDTTQQGKFFLGPKINEVSLTATEKDTFSTGDDNAISAKGTTWVAQTFTAGSDYTIAGVSLLLYRSGSVGNPGVCTVSIRATSAGVPTGSDLCLGTFDGNQSSGAAAGAWQVINFSSTTALTSSTVYAIVLRAPSGDGNNQITWRMDTANGYASGQLCASSDSGATFPTTYTYDALFKTYVAGSTELDTAPVCFAWGQTSGKWFCATAGKIYYYDGIAWVAATTTVTRVQQIVEFDGVLYAARGQATAGTWAAGDEYYTSTDGLTWTVTDLADPYANGFLVAPNPAGTAENIWKFRTPNQVSRTTNGQAGGTAWQSATYVGDTTNNITNLFLSGDKICVGRTDGLFSLDSDGGVHPLLPDELKVNRSTNNFKYTVNWQSATYFSLQRGGGEMTTSETFRPFSPLLELDEVTKLGDIVGIASDRDWLYVAVLEDTVIHIYKGRENLFEGRLRWEWCPWIYVGLNGCQVIQVCQHNSTDRRLWFGYGTHTAYVQLSENPVADANARFASSGHLRMSYTYGTNPLWDKLWQSAVLEVSTKDVVSGAIGATAGETVQVQYLDDTDTSATSVISAATTNGVYETNFSSALNNKRIQFRLDLASNTATATPIVSYFQAKGTEKPTTVRVHEAYYVVGDRPSDRVNTLRSLLRTARTSTTLVKFADLRYGQKTSGTASGDYVWCVMMPGYPKEVEIVHEKGKQPELAIQVRLQEISFTIS